MNKRCLVVLSMIFALTIGGCIGKDFPESSGGLDQDAGADAIGGEDAVDDGGETDDDGGTDDDSGTEDTGPDVEPQGCTQASDCDQPGNDETVECVEGSCVYECDDGFDYCDERGSKCIALGTLDHCSSCGDECPTTGNRVPVCDDESGSHECGVTADCVDGFFDTNDSGVCECEFQRDDDTPGDGVDANCDGVDGVLEETVFADPNADGTAADGSKERPFPDLSQAITEVKRDADKKYILVAGGIIRETIELEDGVSIYGGYEAGEWTDPEFRDTHIAPPVPATPSGPPEHLISVTATDIRSTTILSRLTIRGADASSAAPGSSTYALVADNSPGLEIHDSAIEAGQAANGAEGTDGEDGADRFANGHCTPTPGGEGGHYESSAVPCGASGAHGDQAPDGVRGDTDPAVTLNGASGGDGGTHRCQTEVSTNPPPMDGSNGSNGDRGDAGQPGAAGADGFGSFASGHWQPDASLDPTSGIAGGGGGGGGAGANYQELDTTTVKFGGDGGAGGAGGCAGGAATNGTSGGASFGLVVIGSPLTISNSEVVLGRGGDGGDGGMGGDGVSSADYMNHDPGENGDIGAGVGGRGGNGGPGGDGGDGAGGCGGPSIGVALVGINSISESNLTYNDSNASAGQPGNGAGDDCAGELADSKAYN